MQNDFKALVEKYKADLMQYHAANPSGGEAERYVAKPTAAALQPQAAPKVEPPTPSVPEAEPTDIPEIPIIPPAPQNVPEMPVILPGEPITPQPPQVLQSEQSPDDFANDDVADNDLDDDEGYLQIRTVTAEGALPLKGALAVISDSSGQLIAQVTTDSDGLTAAVPLRTVSRELSEVEGNPEPYDTYNIEISLDGFYKVKSEHVPVFGGITNLQTVSLIPLPEFADKGEEYTIDSPDYTL